MRLLTGNDLKTGAVTWWTGSDWSIHVEDAARGILLAAEHYDSAEPVNLGSGQEISIRDLADKICHFVGFEGHIVWDVSKPNGQPRRCLDVSRAEDRFGFRATTSFDLGLRKTIEWFETTSAPPPACLPAVTLSRK